MYCNIYPNELELGKENNVKHEVSFFRIQISELGMESCKLASSIKAIYFFRLLECLTNQEAYRLTYLIL